MLRLLFVVFCIVSTGDVVQNDLAKKLQAAETRLGKTFLEPVVPELSAEDIIHAKTLQEDPSLEMSVGVTKELKDSLDEESEEDSTLRSQQDEAARNLQRALIKLRRAQIQEFSEPPRRSRFLEDDTETLLAEAVSAIDDGNDAEQSLLAASEPEVASEVFAIAQEEGSKELEQTPQEESEESAASKSPEDEKQDGEESDSEDGELEDLPDDEPLFNDSEEDELGISKKVRDRIKKSFERKINIYKRIAAKYHMRWSAALKERSKFSREAVSWRSKFNSMTRDRNNFRNIADSVGKKVNEWRKKIAEFSALIQELRR